MINSSATVLHDILFDAVKLQDYNPNVNMDFAKSIDTIAFTSDFMAFISEDSNILVILVINEPNSLVKIVDLDKL